MRTNDKNKSKIIENAVRSVYGLDVLNICYLTDITEEAFKYMDKSEKILYYKSGSNDAFINCRPYSGSIIESILGFTEEDGYVSNLIGSDSDRKYGLNMPSRDLNEEEVELFYKVFGKVDFSIKEMQSVMFKDRFKFSNYYNFNDINIESVILELSLKSLSPKSQSPDLFKKEPISSQAEFLSEAIKIKKPLNYYNSKKEGIKEYLTEEDEKYIDCMSRAIEYNKQYTIKLKTKLKELASNMIIYTSVEKIELPKTAETNDIIFNKMDSGEWSNIVSQYSISRTLYLVVQIRKARYDGEVNKYNNSLIKKYGLLNVKNIELILGIDDNKSVNSKKDNREKDINNLKRSKAFNK